MMRRAFWIWAVLLSVPFWVSCAKDDRGEAARAAEACYRHLIEGRYEQYVGCIAYSDSMTDVYRSQMVDLVAQFAAREKKAHGGVIAAQALRDTVSGDVASVFLEVLFGDSTREEVVVPMVKCGGEWKMQ